MLREHVTIVIMEKQSSIYIVELHVAAIRKQNMGCCQGKAATTSLYVTMGAV